jgi:hypothetical protein
MNQYNAGCLNSNENTTSQVEQKVDLQTFQLVDIPPKNLTNKSSNKKKFRIYGIFLIYFFL